MSTESGPKPGVDYFIESALLMDSMETAWGIIANVSNGDWTKQSIEWQEAAIRWRDDHWHVGLDRNGYARFMDKSLEPKSEPVSSDIGRSTCYAARVAQAARILGMPDGSTADDVLKRIIAGQAQATLAQARQLVNKALDLYEGADSHA